MNTLTELFEHELRDIYYAEHKLVEALGQLAQQSTEAPIQDAFLEHQNQTRGHISRLDQVFTALNEPPSGVVCQGVEGLIKEHDQFVKEEQPTSQLLQFYDINAGIKSERYEISSYEGLIQMANQLNRNDVVPMLESNLKEEQAALHKLQGFAKGYNPLDGGKLEGKGLVENVKEAFQRG
jgi:ferritin-like metal-binding protein YciE